MSERVLLTVATTMRIGEPILSQLTMAWYCQNNVTLGADVVSIVVVALSSSKLEKISVAVAVVYVQSDVENVVSRSFRQERVTFEELSDDDVVVKTVVHYIEQITATRIIIGRKNRGVDW